MPKLITKRDIIYSAVGGIVVPVVYHIFKMRKAVVVMTKAKWKYEDNLDRDMLKGILYCYEQGYMHVKTSDGVWGVLSWGNGELLWTMEDEEA